MLQGILYRNLDNHRWQHQLHIYILGYMEPRFREERIGFMAKGRITHHHLQFFLQTYRHLIACKQVGTEYLYQEMKRLDINFLRKIRDKDIEHIKHEVRRETIAHILHFQRHHQVHLLLMLLLVAQHFVSEKSDESQHAH